MSVIKFGQSVYKIAKKGVDKFIKHENALDENRKLINKQRRGKELSAKEYDKFQKNKNIYKNPDKETLKTKKKFEGKKINKGYISKKIGLVKDKDKKRKGGSIKVKCKLGRNRPTKLY
tara:strand:- start:132 stop:485 length:354 start_codon:yes stop_codon:yes gene_type:complete